MDAIISRPFWNHNREAYMRITSSMTGDMACHAFRALGREDIQGREREMGRNRTVEAALKF
jgi:hypothetical protein